MKKVLTFAILIFASVLTFACKDGAKAQPNEPEQKRSQERRSNRNEQGYVY